MKPSIIGSGQTSMSEQFDINMVERLATIEAIVTRIEHQLFGNGNPGEITIIRTDVDELKTYKNKAVGALAVIATLLTIFGSTLAAHMFSSHSAASGQQVIKLDTSGQNEPVGHILPRAEEPAVKAPGNTRQR